MTDGRRRPRPLREVYSARRASRLLHSPDTPQVCPQDRRTAGTQGCRRAAEHAERDRSCSSSSARYCELCIPRFELAAADHAWLQRSHTHTHSSNGDSVAGCFGSRRTRYAAHYTLVQCPHDVSGMRPCSQCRAGFMSAASEAGEAG